MLKARYKLEEWVHNYKSDDGLQYLIPNYKISRLTEIEQENADLHRRVEELELLAMNAKLIVPEPTEAPVEKSWWAWLRDAKAIHKMGYIIKFGNYSITAFKYKNGKKVDSVYLSYLQMFPNKPQIRFNWIEKL